MKPVEFPQQNIILAKDQPEYIPLPAYVDGDGTFITAWDLTEGEMQEFLRTRRIYLTQLTFKNPFQPVRLDIKCPILDETSAPLQ